MKIFLHNIPIKIKSLDKVTSEKLDYAVHITDGIVDCKALKGKVLLKGMSLEMMVDLLQKMTAKPAISIEYIEIGVVNKQEAVKFIKSNFEIVEAGGGIVEKDSKALMILRNDLWDIPKGKLEIGESKEEGAIREVEEETGVKVELKDKIVTTWHTYIRKNKYMLKKTYWYRMTCIDDTNLRPQKEESIEQALFMTPQEIDIALHHSFKTITWVMKQYRKLYH